MIGSVVGGKYRIVRSIGAGGMGTVYEAVHTGTGRRVAVKAIARGDLPATADAVERFGREARAAGGIETRHIVQVLDVGRDEVTGDHFIVMEFLVGEDLRALIERLGPLPPDLALRIVAQASIGLERAHEAGVIHRDVKPANIFLARGDDGEIVVKLLDFGIAKMRRGPLASTETAALTRTGSVLGSPMYMSPEQIREAKDVDARTDTWSLGVVLYQALSGRTPWRDLALGELVIAICTQHPPNVRACAPWVAPLVAQVIDVALAPRREQRFATQTAMSRALRTLLPEGPRIDARELTPRALHERSRVKVASPAAAETLGATALLDGLGGARTRAAHRTEIEASPLSVAPASMPLHCLHAPRSRGLVIAIVAACIAVASAIGGASVVVRLTRSAGIAPSSAPSAIVAHRSAPAARPSAPSADPDEPGPPAPEAASAAPVLRDASAPRTRRRGVPATAAASTASAAPSGTTTPSQASPARPPIDTVFE